MSEYSDHRSVVFDKDNNEIGKLNSQFICDGLIAETIQELRNKGYETTESCAGHSNELLVERYEREYVLNGKTVKDFLFENYLNGRHVQVTSIGNGKIRYSVIFNYAKTYIIFPMRCDFSEPVPDGFIVVRDGNGRYTCVERYYSVMRGNGTYRTVNELDADIKRSNERLYAWAKSLKHVSELEDIKTR